MSITHGSIYVSALAIISESVYPRRPHLAFTQRSKAKQHHCTNQNARPHRNSVRASRQDFGIATGSRNIVLRHLCIVIDSCIDEPSGPSLIGEAVLTPGNDIAVFSTTSPLAPSDVNEPETVMVGGLAVRVVSEMTMPLGRRALVTVSDEMGCSTELRRGVCTQGRRAE